ncbi:MULTISPECIES: TRAP transporter TatT component family protein [unclassified Halomonas]|uniref:TRAP transporter TatT component family protein n=1 Tax=unclassified Halomonas TaxID=2609666 RepID=UPI0021E418B6|nr:MULTISPECIES: TRAP transporter TatT component family protein [unclassified Halomonas]UYF98651.1 TRAP transporter TatT component family protein [Halomonas sp. GD1P12]WNL40236.1 TRAP transporter TatT component family protein [Halomonas sp. PAMB 3232]
MRTHTSRWLLAVTLGGALALSPLAASAYQDELFSLKNRWEHTVTELPANQRQGTLEALSDEAEALASQNPNEADVLVWQGIILASYARERGGLGALASAKEARAVLERAIELDPQGSNASAYVTLGALYDRAPGRPLGFGNSDTAERMFQRALEIRPNGIDVNFYYAAFLKEEGDIQGAREYATRAVEGTARENRQLSDEALRREAQAFLQAL